MLAALIVCLLYLALVLFARQLRHPSGFLGRHLMASLFDQANADLNGLMAELLETQPAGRALEIGFGSGFLIQHLTRTGRGQIAGIDVSDEMVQVAKTRLRSEIEAGHVELRKAGIERIPYPDGTFNQVFTINTIYFWPEPAVNLLEIHRVLAAGGRCHIGFRPKRQLFFLAPVFKLYSEEDVHTLLVSAGFRDIRKHTRNPRTHLCLTAVK